MQSSRKRLTKEELHQDEFTSALFRLVGYAEKNYPKILAGLGVVVVVGLIGYFIRDSSNRRTQAWAGYGPACAMPAAHRQTSTHATLIKTDFFIKTNSVA